MASRLLLLLIISMFLVMGFFSHLSISAIDNHRKELRTKNEKPIIKLITSTQPTRIDPSRVIQLSRQPRVFLYSGFLSDEESDHLISLAHNNLGKPFVENHNSEKTSATPLVINQDDIVARIEDRICGWTFLPKENSENLQILHYVLEDTEQVLDNFGVKGREGSVLMGSVVMYLSDVIRGGEILFPNTKLEVTEPKDETWSDCSKAGYAIKPVAGDALFAFHVHPNSSADSKSLYTRCPHLEGEQWLAIKSFHLKPIFKEKVLSESESSDNEYCTDEDDNCTKWAALGECQKNPIYMIGTQDYYGSCRKSCNVC